MAAAQLQAVELLVRSLHARGFLLTAVGEEAIPRDLAITESAKEILPDLELPTGFASRCNDFIVAGRLTWVAASPEELAEVDRQRTGRRVEHCPRPVPVWPRVSYASPGAVLQMVIDTTPSIGVDGAIEITETIESGDLPPVLLCFKLTSKAADALSSFEVWNIPKLQVDPTFNMENIPPEHVFVETGEIASELKSRRAGTGDVASIRLSIDPTARFMGWTVGTLLRYRLPYPDLGTIIQYRIVIP